MNSAQTYPAATRTPSDSAISLGRKMLNKVPEITLYFWVIKILCTTVGETAADNLNENLGLGLSGTSYVMGAILIGVLVVQLRARKYVPGVYWLVVVLLSIVGTLITDNMADQGVALMTTNIIFSSALAATFATWFAFERTLSVHTIFTTRRETFYWLAILFTFALGTSVGDYLSETLELGYLAALGIFAGAIVVIAVLHFGLKMNAILSFWLAYILTRPLGASIGDYLASPSEEGGLGLGTNLTSIVFLGLILALVIFLAVSKRDVIKGKVLSPSWAGSVARGETGVLVVSGHAATTPALVDAVRARAARSKARFFVLVPNPDHLSLGDGAGAAGDNEEILKDTLPQTQEQVGTTVEGGVATNSNVFDDIVAAMEGDEFGEVIIETPPSHLSHWLHTDLPSRISDLGYPVTVVPATG
jgi:uncharacterized membrane-anchored protein